MRVPLPPTLLTRISDMARDRRNINGVYEKGDVIKRPGVVTTNYNFTSPIQGGIGLNGGLVLIYGDTIETVPTFWSALRTYNLGDLVWYLGELWEAQSTNQGNVPFDGSAYWVWSFIGGSCEYSSQVSYSIGDGVCFEDPTTQQLTRYTARSNSSYMLSPSSSGWQKYLWGRGAPSGPTRYWYTGAASTIGDSPYSAGAAFLATGALGNFPTSGIDGFGRPWVETITNSDFLPGGYETLMVGQANPPHPAFSVTNFRALTISVKP